jgi:phenylalanyl-tRNA synthetase beta chain
LRTLDGELRKLDPSDLVIADPQRAVALAGIMGGEETELADDTSEILLEAANFEPVGIMRSSERLALRTEGSNRWEKGVDPYTAEQAAIYATELLVELAKARYAGEIDVQGDMQPAPVTSLRPERTDAVAGLEIPPIEQGQILERLGFEVEEGTGVVTVPTWRARDVTREVDVIEEVIRVHGLEQVPFTLPLRREMFGRLTEEQRLRRVIEDVLAGAGLSEAYTTSFAAEGPVRIVNPMHAAQAALRATLLDGLVEVAERNVHAGNERIRLFEIARVYLPDERLRVGAQEPFLHPGKSAHTDAGWFGELHPARLEGSWGVFELDLPTLLAGVEPVPAYEDVITFPPVREDIAVVVGEDVPAGDLVEAALAAAGAELREARVFDVYRGQQVGEGKKSVALALVFQSPERTLSDEDAAALRGKIMAALADRFGAELRG